MKSAIDELVDAFDERHNVTNGIDSLLKNMYRVIINQHHTIMCLENDIKLLKENSLTFEQDIQDIKTVILYIESDVSYLKDK